MEYLLNAFADGRRQRRSRYGYKFYRIFVRRWRVYGVSYLVPFYFQSHIITTEIHDRIDLLHFYATKKKKKNIYRWTILVELIAYVTFLSERVINIRT